MTAPTPPDPREQPLQYYGPPRPPTYTPGMPPISGAPVSPYGAPVSPVYVVQARPTSGLAVASLIFGILGVLSSCCSFGIFSILAVICGHAARGDTKTGAAGGDGMAMAGLILGYIVVGPAIAFSIWMVLAGGLGAVSN